MDGCCSNNATENSFGEMLAKVVSFLEDWDYQDFFSPTSDNVVLVLFVVHVIFVVSFLLSYCKSQRSYS